jgi:hypothetical protein
MIAIKTLQKRLDLLEERPTTEPDLVEIVLADLSDDDLELLHEHAVLRESGFNDEQAASMMGERWRSYQEATAHFQEGYLQAIDAFRELEKAQIDKPSKRFSSGNTQCCTWR